MREFISFSVALSQFCLSWGFLISSIYFHPFGSVTNSYLTMNTTLSGETCLFVLSDLLGSGTSCLDAVGALCVGECHFAVCVYLKKKFA